MRRRLALRQGASEWRSQPVRALGGEREPSRHRGRHASASRQGRCLRDQPRIPGRRPSGLRRGACLDRLERAHRADPLPVRHGCQRSDRRGDACHHRLASAASSQRPAPSSTEGARGAFVSGHHGGAGQAKSRGARGAAPRAPYGALGAPQGSAEQGRAGQGRAGQGRAEQGRAGQGRAGASSGPDTPPHYAPSGGGGGGRAVQPTRTGVMVDPYVWCTHQRTGAT